MLYLVEQTAKTRIKVVYELSELAIELLLQPRVTKLVTDLAGYVIFR